MDFNSFKTNQEMENNGVWRPCGNGRVYITSAASDRYKKALRRLLGPHEMEINLGVMDEAVAEKLMLRAMAEGILLNWEGFTENGEECIFTIDNAVRLLTEAPRFRQFVMAEAQNIENFREKKEAIEVKNS